MQKFQVLVVDDMMATREGLSAILNRVKGVDRIMTCESREEALYEISHNSFNIALIEMHLGQDNGIALGRELAFLDPDLKVIIYTKKASGVIAAEIFRHDTDTIKKIQAEFSNSNRFLSSGSRVHAGTKPATCISGYLLLKNITPSNLEQYFYLQHGRVVDQEILNQIIDRLNRTSLTPRERECCELIAQGKSNRQITQQLGISQQAVENLINSLYNKLSIEGEPKDPGRRVLLALTMRNWYGMDAEAMAG